MHAHDATTDLVVEAHHAYGIEVAGDVFRSEEVTDGRRWFTSRLEPG